MDTIVGLCAPLVAVVGLKCIMSDVGFGHLYLCSVCLIESGSGSGYLLSWG